MPSVCWICPQQRTSCYFVHSHATPFNRRQLSPAGFLYPPGDYQTAFALTKQLVRDRALRERVGGAARLEVSSSHSHHVVVRQLKAAPP